jgi:hypothetical protein
LDNNDKHEPNIHFCMHEHKSFDFYFTLLLAWGFGDFHLFTIPPFLRSFPFFPRLLAFSLEEFTHDSIGNKGFGLSFGLGNGNNVGGCRGLEVLVDSVLESNHSDAERYC